MEWAVRLLDPPVAGPREEPDFEVGLQDVVLRRAIGQYSLFAAYMIVIL